MPVLPELLSIKILSGVSCPLRSASSTMRNAARALTDPLGLYHSALAYTPTCGDTPQRWANSLKSSKGVLPIWSSTVVISACTCPVTDAARSVLVISLAIVFGYGMIVVPRRDWRLEIRDWGARFLQSPVSNL